jgi:deazaflavin-dependent oxidoreductase (nitroreductase family)
MINFLIKIFMDLNVFVIRASRGKVGTLLARQTILLLHTVGRRSGRQFVTPISYFSCDGYYFLVGSNWGRKHNAAWYYNLMAQPRTTIEIHGRKIIVNAYPVEGPEYERLWNCALARYPGYQHYRDNLGRHIPIMVLKPDTHPEAA